MSYGRPKLVSNLKPRMGSASDYYFVKVYSGSAEWQEEYWLVTPWDSARFEKRGAGQPAGRLGFLSTVDADYGSEGVTVTMGGRTFVWVLTPDDLERVRARSERNAEDIAANRESWLRDLFD